MSYSKRSEYLVATVLLTVSTVLVAGVSQCKRGWQARAGFHTYDDSGVVLNHGDPSEMENVNCDSGQCIVSIHQTDKGFAAYFNCSYSTEIVVFGRWRVDNNTNTAHLSCHQSEETSPCNDATRISDSMLHDGEAKRDFEDALRQIGFLEDGSVSASERPATPSATDPTVLPGFKANIEAEEEPDMPIETAEETGNADPSTSTSGSAAAADSEGPAAPDQATESNAAAVATAAATSGNDAAAQTTAGPTKGVAVAGLPLAVVSLLAVPPLISLSLSQIMEYIVNI